jgi:ABC-type Fe3+-siderophore transport system permease subunit
MEVLVPIFVCVVLPVMVVAIVFAASMNSDNKRAQILIKAIESGNGIDADRLAEALRKPHKSHQEVMNLRLLRGCVFTLLGVASAIYGIYMQCSYAESIAPKIAYMICGVMSAIGIAYLITYFVTRNQINVEK